MQALTAASINHGEFEQFRQLIYQIAGICLSDAKKTLLVGRLGKRLRHLGLGSFGEYFHYLSSGREPGELQLMVDLITTNETYFFREEKHFDFLRELARAHPARQSLDVWSAASSTGEEAYTMCMVLADELGLDGAWTVTGSDISLSVLEVATAGQYKLERRRGLAPEYLRKYCLKGIRSQEGTFIVDDRLRAHTRFLQANLKQPPTNLGPFDVIFLRNVMIYFDQPTKRRVVDNLIQRLRPGGHFIVGQSETLNGIADNLQLVRPTIYRKPA